MSKRPPRLDNRVLERSRSTVLGLNCLRLGPGSLFQAFFFSVRPKGQLARPYSSNGLRLSHSQPDRGDDENKYDGKERVSWRPRSSGAANQIQIDENKLSYFVECLQESGSR